MAQFFWSNATTSPTTYELGTFRAFSGDFSLADVLVWDRLPHVKSVLLDRHLEVCDVQELAPVHLVRLSQNGPVGSTTDYVYDGSSGAGVDVHILDSGIVSTHRELAGRVHKMSDFVRDGLEDSSGHGTSLAVLVAGETYGVAKQCNVVSHKVADRRGRSKLSHILAALQLVVAEQAASSRPSLVLLASIMRHNPVLNHAVEQVVAAGIPVVVAAGNDNSPACRYSPASVSGALTVASFSAHQDLLARFSNYGPCVDVFAPGVNVQTSGPAGVPLVRSGTSYSAGISAGLVAYFMGMGNSGTQAVGTVKRLLEEGVLGGWSLFWKVGTPNRVVYNGGGQPLW